VTAVPLDDDALAGIEHHLPALEQVYRTLCQHEAMTPEELAEETGLAVGTVRNKLTALRHQGRAEPLGDGRWRGIGPATLAVRDGSHSPFTHSIVE
jgi:DNA-binding IclR family transcriptional regulator